MGTTTVSTITAILQTATNFGVLGIVFWLFLTGKLHNDDEMKRVETDLAAEREAHEMTRQALALANERANVSVLVAQMAAKALSPPGTVVPGIGDIQ